MFPKTEVSQVKCNIQTKLYLCMFNYLVFEHVVAPPGLAAPRRIPRDYLYPEISCMLSIQVNPIRKRQRKIHTVSLFPRKASYMVALYFQLNHISGQTMNIKTMRLIHNTGRLQEHQKLLVPMNSDSCKIFKGK